MRNMSKMKQIVPIIALLLIMVECGEKKGKSIPEQKTSKDYVVGIDSKGDTLTLEDIEKTIDSLNHYKEEHSNERVNQEL